MVVDFEATPARTYDEVAATKVMLKRTEERLDLKLDRLIADTAYGTGKFLGWLVGTGIRPHIPMQEQSIHNDGTFQRSNFRFDKDTNEYTCPVGKTLGTSGKVYDDESIRYRASKFDCDPCPLNPKCCPNTPARQVPRDVNEEARDQARSYMNTLEFARSRDERKKVEIRFAQHKTHHKFERMRLRGPSGARDGFHLAAIVQNLKTMALRMACPPFKRTVQSTA